MNRIECRNLYDDCTKEAGLAPLNDTELEEILDKFNHSSSGYKTIPIDDFIKTCGPTIHQSFFKELNIEENDLNLFPEIELMNDPNADLEIEQVDLNDSANFSLGGESSDEDDDEQGEGEGKKSNSKKMHLNKASDPNYEKLLIHLRSVMALNDKGNMYGCCCEAMCLNVTGTDENIPNKGSKVEHWGIGIGLYFNFILS